MFLRDFNLVVTVITRGHAVKVMESAKKAGAEGATIITGRGNSIHETDTVLGISIQPEKEVVMILVKKQLRKKVMREICRSSGVSEEGQGLCFCLPVDEVGGIIHLLPHTQTRKPIKIDRIPPREKTEEKQENNTEKSPKNTENEQKNTSKKA